MIRTARFGASGFQDRAIVRKKRPANVASA